jgi:hypothetical protein
MTSIRRTSPKKTLLPYFFRSFYALRIVFNGRHAIAARVQELSNDLPDPAESDDNHVLSTTLVRTFETH